MTISTRMHVADYVRRVYCLQCISWQPSEFGGMNHQHKFCYGSANEGKGKPSLNTQVIHLQLLCSYDHRPEGVLRFLWDCQGRHLFPGFLRDWMNQPGGKQLELMEMPGG